MQSKQHFISNDNTDNFNNQQYMNNENNENNHPSCPQSPSNNPSSINTNNISNEGKSNKNNDKKNNNNNHKRIPSKSYGDNINKNFYRDFYNGCHESHDIRNNKSRNNGTTTNNNNTNSNTNNNNFSKNNNSSSNNNNSNSNIDGAYTSLVTNNNSALFSPFNAFSNYNHDDIPHHSSTLQQYSNIYLNELQQQQFFTKLQQEFLLQSSGLLDPYYYLTTQQHQQYLLQIQMLQYLKQHQQQYDSSSGELSHKLQRSDNLSKESNAVCHKTPSPNTSSSLHNNYNNVHKTNNKNSNHNSKPSIYHYANGSKSHNNKTPIAPATLVTKPITTPSTTPTSTPNADNNTSTHKCNWCKPGEKICAKTFKHYSQLLEHLKEHVNEADVAKTPLFPLSLYNTIYGNAMALSNAYNFPTSLLQMLYYLSSSSGISSTTSTNSLDSLQYNYPSTPQSVSPSQFSSTSTLISEPPASYHRYHPYKSIQGSIPSTIPPSTSSSKMYNHIKENENNTIKNNRQSSPLKNSHTPFLSTPYSPSSLSTTSSSSSSFLISSQHCNDELPAFSSNNNSKEH